MCFCGEGRDGTGGSVCDARVLTFTYDINTTKIAEDDLSKTPYGNNGVLGVVGSGVGAIGSGAMWVERLCLC